MLKRERLEELLGSLWKIEEVFQKGWDICMEEVEDRELLLVQLEKVRDVIASHQETAVSSIVEATWHAAEVLLGPNKLSGLRQLYAGEAEDTLTDIAVAMALLGTAEPSEEGIRVTASDKLHTRVQAKVTKLMTADRKPGSPQPGPPGEEGVLWRMACQLGWTELLPWTFEIRKLGRWESDEEFAVRAAALTSKVAKLFP